MLTRGVESARARAASSLDRPAAGLAGQLVLLGVLSWAPGLGAAGWLTGVAFGVILAGALHHGLHRSGQSTLGPANRVTLARSVLVGAVAALAVDSLTGSVSVSLMVTLAGVALLLDAVDGRVARRTRTSSPLGARFDMEVDAFLILALCLALARPIGLWVLSIGAMRYAFVVAGRLLPWLNAPLPPRFSRKVVAAVQGIVLVVVLAEVLPTWLAVTALLVALALLSWSFGLSLIHI